MAETEDAIPKKLKKPWAASSFSTVSKSGIQPTGRVAWEKSRILGGGSRHGRGVLGGLWV
jgi:hypothetical protein